MFNYYLVLAFLIQSYKYVHCAMIFSRRNLCGVLIMHCHKNDKVLRSCKTCKNRRAYKIIRLQLGIYILPFCIFNILSWNAPSFKYPKYIYLPSIPLHIWKCTKCRNWMIIWMIHWGLPKPLEKVRIEDWTLFNHKSIHFYAFFHLF